MKRARIQNRPRIFPRPIAYDVSTESRTPSTIAPSEMSRLLTSFPVKSICSQNSVMLETSMPWGRASGPFWAYSAEVLTEFIAAISTGRIIASENRPMARNTIQAPGVRWFSADRPLLREALTGAVEGEAVMRRRSDSDS